MSVACNCLYIGMQQICNCLRRYAMSMQVNNCLYKYTAGRYARQRNTLYQAEAGDRPTSANACRECQVCPQEELPLQKTMEFEAGAAYMVSERRRSLDRFNISSQRIPGIYSCLKQYGSMQRTVARSSKIGPFLSSSSFLLPIYMIDAHTTFSPVNDLVCVSACSSNKRVNLFPYSKAGCHIQCMSTLLGHAYGRIWHLEWELG